MIQYNRYFSLSRSCILAHEQCCQCGPKNNFQHLQVYRRTLYGIRDGHKVQVVIICTWRRRQWRDAYQLPVTSHCASRTQGEPKAKPPVFAGSFIILSIIHTGKFISFSFITKITCHQIWTEDMHTTCVKAEVLFRQC